MQPIGQVARCRQGAVLDVRAKQPEQAAAQAARPLCWSCMALQLEAAHQGRGERRALLSHLPVGDKDRGPLWLQSLMPCSQGRVWERVLPPTGVDGDSLPRETQPNPRPQGLGKGPCPCGSSLQRVKAWATRWPLRYLQVFELSPVAQGKQRGSAKQRSQWKGWVSRACGQILPVKATRTRSSPVLPAPTTSLKEQPEPGDHSPAAVDDHLGHTRGWWGHGHGAAVDMETEGRCLWASPLTAFFPH